MMADPATPDFSWLTERFARDPTFWDRLLSLLGSMCDYAGPGGTSSWSDALELAQILGLRLLRSPDGESFCIGPAGLPEGFDEAYAPDDTTGWVLCDVVDHDGPVPDDPTGDDGAANDEDG